MKLNRIYNENCFETMKRMPNNFVDVVITSPPYNKAGYEGFLRKVYKSDTWSNRNIAYGEDANSDFVNEADYRKDQIKLLNELQRIIKPNGSVFYNHKVRVASHIASHPIEWIMKSKLTFRQQIIWNRKGSPAIAPIRFLPSTELIFWLTKTPCQPNFVRKSDVPFAGEVWDILPKPNPNHPGPMPEMVVENILRCIDGKPQSLLVYDPYAGIGTTCNVAKRFGMNYLGSEKVKQYIDFFNKKK